MIGHKRVAKCVKHDESQHRAQGHNEKSRCDLDAAPEISTQKIESSACDDSQ